jgi:hypothetical protein
VTRPAGFHRQWSHWRRSRQAAARRSHYARRTGRQQALPQRWPSGAGLSDAEPHREMNFLRHTSLTTADTTKLAREA